MPRKYSSSSKMSLKHDNDHDDNDPGREVIEKNLRSRLQRIADHTQEELNKVLKRVDNTLHNYESSVQSSLVQHGHADMSNVEHVADIKELESLLNDSLAKQRYKQRLMIFIVGQTEQASEKAKLLQQLEQFFNEQKQSFSGREFNPSDEINEGPDETDLALKAFDVKDCFAHVKALSTRLDELNEEIIQYLILNAGSKQQAKGKKKLAQIAKETKEQLASLQSKLEMANNEMINKDNKIETLEKEIETIRNEIKTHEDNQKYLQNDLNESKNEIRSYKKQITELEKDLKEYQEQINDLTKTISDIQQPKIEQETTEETNNQSPDTILPNQTDEEQISDAPIESSFQDKEVQTSDESNEIPSDIPKDQPDFSALFNDTELIDVDAVPIENLPTAYTDLRKFAIVRIRDLSDEIEKNNETLETLRQEFNQYKITCEKEQIAWIEKSEDAYRLQIKAQRAAEDAINHLEAYMNEREHMKAILVHQETQTDEQEILLLERPTSVEESPKTDEQDIPLTVTPSSERPTPVEEPSKTDEQDIPVIVTPSSEHPTPVEEPPKTDELDIPHIRILSPEHPIPIDDISNDQSSIYSKIDFESIENFRRESIKDKYVSLIEEKKQELDEIRQQADMILSRPSSIRERIILHSLENSTDMSKRRPSYSSRSTFDDKETQADIESVMKQDQTQQTSFIISRPSSAIDQYKLPFYHLYEMIYKFRYSITHLLEQYKFGSLSECLQMIKQLLSDDNNNLPKDFIENSERILKDIIKVLQTCLSKINEKEKEIIQETQSITETSSNDNNESILLQQKEAMINELKTKYEHLSNIFDHMNKKLEEESTQNERLIRDQQKLIQNLQHELSRIQKRLNKIETEGIVEPGILFTRLDAERNDQTLQQAVFKGKVPETTYNELNETMADYVRLPSQQLSNLVKRYIRFRKVTELEDRIQSEVLDNETKVELEKMELLHERRADQISERMSDVRQQRANLARILTEKFDNLEEESCIFLIRPVYSYQGRVAVQSYMKNINRRREELFKEEAIKKKHHPSRQSFHSQQKLVPLAAIPAANDDDRLFHIDKSSSIPIDNNEPIRLNEITHLQEYDIQRALMPVSQSSTTLLSAFTNNHIDPCVPSLNLRSYVALSRPGIGNIRLGKSNDVLHPVSRENLSALSMKSQETNPPTPYNSSAGDLRRKSPPLPPIKRSINLNITPTINEKHYSGFMSSVSANES